MRHAHYKLLPHRERPRHRMAADYPAVYLQERRRGRASLPFTSPADIAGLKLWLRADTLALADNDPVALWPDSSGSGNDVAQSDGLKMPLFKTGILNGQPVVRFDGVDDTLFKLAAGGFSCTQGHTIIAVLNPTTAVSFGMAVVTNPAFNELRQTGGGGAAEWMVPSGFFQVDGSEYLEGLWRIWTGTYNVASHTIQLFINGVSQGTAVDAGPLSVSDIYLGSRADLYFWLGDMAEVLVYDAALSATDRQNIEAYLAAKYALS